MTTPLLKANNTSEREERLLTGVSGHDVQRADSCVLADSHSVPYVRYRVRGWPANVDR